MRVGYYLVALVGLGIATANPDHVFQKSGRIISTGVGFELALFMRRMLVTVCGIFLPSTAARRLNEA